MQNEPGATGITLDPPGLSMHYQKGEFIIRSGPVETIVPAPCMADFSMTRLIQALHSNAVYATATTAQVTAFISARDNTARYAWSFGDHTPCGSAVVLPLPLLMAALYDLTAPRCHREEPAAVHIELPKWLQLGIDPNMKCLAPLDTHNAMLHFVLHG